MHELQVHQIELEMQNEELRRLRDELEVSLARYTELYELYVALYPALRRFEQMGAIEREIERQQGKPDRHIYHLTALGHELLRDLLCEFPPEVARRMSEFFVRVSFFELLEPPERLAILDARRAFLLGALALHERIRAKVAAERLPFPPHAQQVLRFQEGQTRAELAWVESLARDVAPTSAELD